MFVRLLFKLSGYGLPFVFLISSFISCEKFIQLEEDGDGYKPKLVVESYVVAGDTIKVLVSLSSEIYSEEVMQTDKKIIGLDGAEVVIEHNNIIDTLEYFESKTEISGEFLLNYYKSSFQIANEGIYKIRVKYNTLTAESECSIPKAEEIGTIHIKTIKKENGNDSIKINLMLKGELSSHYFICNVKFNGTARYENWTPGSVKYFSDYLIYSEYFKIENGSNIIELKGKTTERLLVEYSDDSYYSVEVFTIEENYYNFLEEQFNSVFQVYNPLFASGKYNSSGNVANGFGIFTGMSLQKMNVGVND